jgi:hypothetical protein
LQEVKRNLVAHKLVFLGDPAEGLALESHQELTVGCGVGFLGKAKTARNPYRRNCCRIFSQPYKRAFPLTLSELTDQPGESMEGKGRRAARVRAKAGIELGFAWATPNRVGHTH